jgi:hypothetical protein
MLLFLWTGRKEYHKYLSVSRAVLSAVTCYAEPNIFIFQINTWMLPLSIIWNVFIKYLSLEFCPRRLHDKTEKSELTNLRSTIQWHRCSCAMRTLRLSIDRKRNIWRKLICVHTVLVRLMYVKVTDASYRLVYNISYFDTFNQVWLNSSLKILNYVWNKLKFKLRNK